jgi:hypothetical protein
MAPRQWFNKLQATLLQLGFKASKCDPSLFILSALGQVLYLLIYVNDFILTGTSSSLIQSIITQLNDAFSLKHLGDLDYFLGIEVKSLLDGSLALN